MKKIKYAIITVLLTIWFMPMTVLAKGDITLSPSVITITKGSSKTFNVKADNSAGRVDLTSSDTSIATISESSLFLDMSSATVTVTGNKVGSTTIKITASDVTTYDDEDLSGKTYTVQVLVVEPTTNNNTNNNVSSNNTSTKSTNNKIKEISIEGYELIKVDDNNYELMVGKDVDSVKVIVEAEDSKAKVTGVGEHELNIGDNEIEVIVTSESGKENKVKIKVIKKEEFYIEDLDMLLNGTSNDIDIRINSDTIITTEQLEKIKESDKLVNFDYFDGNNRLVYSWIVDGNKLVDTKEILTTISYTTNYKNEISTLSGDIDGLIVSFKHNATIQEGVSTKLYVKDKFNDNSLVKLYYYDLNTNTLTQTLNNLAVKDGYIEFSVKNSGDYFMSISDLKPTTVVEKESLNIFMIISIIELIIIIILIILNISNRKNKSKSQALDTNSFNSATTNTDSIIAPNDLTTPFATTTMDEATPIVDINNVASTSNNNIESITPIDTSSNSFNYYNTTKTVGEQSFITGTVGVTSNSVAIDNQTNPYNSQPTTTNYTMNNYNPSITNTDTMINPFTPMNSGQ